MKFKKIKQLLNESRVNGVYIEQPFFSSNERLYLAKSGKLFWVKSIYTPGESTDKFLVKPTELSWPEYTASDWYFRDFGEEQPRKSIR